MAWCGLEWDPACLEFHKTRRPVRTASAAQVRRPVYASSIGRWKNYEHVLAPLFAKLRNRFSDTSVPSRLALIVIIATIPPVPPESDFSVIEPARAGASPSLGGQQFGRGRGPTMQHVGRSIGRQIVGGWNDRGSRVCWESQGWGSSKPTVAGRPPFCSWPA